MPNGQKEPVMSLKDILVHLDADPRSAVRLEIAAGLARGQGAHLTGLFVVDIPNADYLYGSGLLAVGMGADRMLDVMVAQARAVADPVEASFQEALRVHGLQGEWRIVEGHTPSVIGTAARYVDLVVVGQADDPRREGNRGRATVETVLMTSGRPMLTIPFAGDFPVLTDHVLVAWNAGREATRAVHDALPLLRQARQVTVLMINPRGARTAEDARDAHHDIGRHLVRHGVPAETHSTVADGIAGGEALLSYASDISATMIVAGGYGHSRARELVFGGVTRTLLAEMTVPVLFSH
jgi:nucleotide-binding universal stress UspA family protein